MEPKTEDFTLRVDGMNGICPAGEAWGEQQIQQKKIPVLACEGPCIRGDIARLAANRVTKEEPFRRACTPEALFVPHSSMARWVKEADKVVMVNGCFLKCIGRVLNNLVEEEKIIHIDALKLYNNKYSNCFYMEDIPEAERIDTARYVADQILPGLREKVASGLNSAGRKDESLEPCKKETINTSSSSCSGSK